MRIEGQEKLGDYSQEIRLPRPGGSDLVLTVTPLPLGFHRRLRQHGINSPVPPRRVARDSQQKPLRDERGQALFVEELQDSVYLDALELYHQRVAVLVLVEGLKADSRVEFSTKAPLEGDWAEYADQLYEELEQAGFCAGDMIFLCREIGKLSNLFDAHVEERQRDFFSATTLEGST